jgi:hypothetical protein
MGDIFLNAKNVLTDKIQKEVGEIIKIPGKGLYKFDGKKWNKVDTISELVENYIPYGNEGQISYIKEDGSSVRINDWIVKVGNFIDDPELFEQVKNEVVDQTVIFNSWYRFSHDKSGNYPANADELKSWKINDDGTISSTINSTTYIGFVSLKEYDYYELEVQLVSTSGDNDRMGVVIAFYKDPETGKEYTLSALRDNEGFTWRIYYNYAQSDAKVLFDKSDVITKGDNWNKYPNGTKIKIIRKGNEIYAITTQNNSLEYDENSAISFNLNDFAETEIFKGPKKYGFSCHSQSDTTFKNIIFKNISPIAIDSFVFDMKQNKVYDKKEKKYIDGDIFSIIGKGRIVKDINTGKMWFLSPSKEFILITSVDDVEKYYFSKVEILELLRDLLKYVISPDATSDGIDDLINSLIESVNSGEI